LHRAVPHEFTITRRVEFSETDMAGIMHYSNFFRFMETAEHAFFRSLGFSIVTTQTDPHVGWPRVHAGCDFKQPLRFEDEVEVRMVVTEKRSKSLGYQFQFRKVGEPALVALGRLTVVCVVKGADGKMSASPIPDELAAKIDVAPADAVL
jgi:YbgC/YbaW family acyl-CoA thioester hydrolase